MRALFIAVAILGMLVISVCAFKVRALNRHRMAVSELCRIVDYQHRRILELDPRAAAMEKALPHNPGQADAQEAAQIDSLEVGYEAVGFIGVALVLMGGCGLVLLRKTLKFPLNEQVSVLTIDTNRWGW